MKSLTELFPDGVPAGFTERTLDKVHEISIPWKGCALSLFNEAAGIKKKLNGHFTSPHGSGYCIGASESDRMLYHFPL